MLRRASLEILGQVVLEGLEDSHEVQSADPVEGSRKDIHAAGMVVVPADDVVEQVVGG